MPVSINGNTGVITGLAVGGLPDGIVDTDMLAADSVTAPKIGSKTFTSYAIICDQKAQNTDSGTLTSGAWYTRDLNTELLDPDGIVSISSNKFTLQAGSYFIEASAPAYKVDQYNIKLYQTSGTQADIAFGTAEYANANEGNVANRSFLFCRVTISTSTDYEIRQRSSTTKSNNGRGVQSNQSVEIYTVVKIFKEA